MTDAMMTPVRPKSGDKYNRRVAEQTSQAFERDLQQKYDKRSHLYLSPGKELVITSDDLQFQYGVGIKANGQLRLKNMATGVDGTFLIDWESVEGLSQQLANLEAGYEADDSAITSAYLAADAIVASDAESARAALSTTLTTSYTAADVVLEGNLQADIDTRATIVQLTATESSLNGSIAAVSSELTTETSARTAADSLNTAAIGVNASDIAANLAAIGVNTVDITNRATNTRVDGVETTLTGAIATTNSNLSAETVLRASGDTTNANAISVNAGDIGTNATGIATNLATLGVHTIDIANRATLSQLALAETTAANATATVQTNLDAESALRLSGDAGLQLDINTRATNTRVDTVETDAAAATAASESTLRAEYQSADTSGLASANTYADAEVATEAAARAAGDSAQASNLAATNVRVGDVEATASTLTEAFIDSNGNAVAGIRLVAAADGSDPAVIELTSADGASRVRLGGDTEIDGDLVVNGTITTEGLAIGAVTNSPTPFEDDAATSMTVATWTDAATLDFESVGIGVELRGSAEVTGSGFGGGPGTFSWRILRDATVIKGPFDIQAAEVTEDLGGGIFRYTKTARFVADTNDIPSSGTYTYKLQVNLTGNGGTSPTQSVSQRYLSGREFKR